MKYRVGKDILCNTFNIMAELVKINVTRYLGIGFFFYFSILWALSLFSLQEVACLDLGGELSRADTSLYMARAPCRGWGSGTILSHVTRRPTSTCLVQQNPNHHLISRNPHRPSENSKPCCPGALLQHGETINKTTASLKQSTCMRPTI